MIESYRELQNYNLSVQEQDKIFYPAYIQEENFFTRYLKSRVADQTIEEYPEKLPGTIWAITSFFNPAKYKNKYKNFKCFRESSKKQGLKLLTVELSFDGEAAFDIQEEDTDILLRVHGDEKNILWQKEALLNIALKNLPDDCDKVVWIDCDIVFHNNNWVNETVELLERFNVIQPFSSMVLLPRGVSNSQSLESIAWGFEEGKMAHSLARGVSYIGKEALSEYKYFSCGTIGYAWAIRREILESVGGFFDLMILGGADALMTHAFYGHEWNRSNDPTPTKVLSKAEAWIKEIGSKTKASVFYTSGVVDHLWHGNVENRKYEDRWRALADFDPDRDLHKTPNGIYKWSEGSDELREQCGNYFHSRKEECTES